MAGFLAPYGFLSQHRYLIHDRDPLFTESFAETLATADVRVVKLPARSPNLNAHAERFVRSIKSECLAKITPLGEGHLRHAVREFADHYHLERNHQGLGNRLIDVRGDPAGNDGAIACRERLGGVLKFYERAA